MSKYIIQLVDTYTRDVIVKFLKMKKMQKITL